MSTTVKLYGLPYCDATVAVTQWLQQRGYTTQLHNYKLEGISESKLLVWCDALGWEKVLNKRSTTWRSLAKDKQEAITGQGQAIALMLVNTSLIKRPVIEYNNILLAGFDEKKLSNIFI